MRGSEMSPGSIAQTSHPGIRQRDPLGHRTNEFGERTNHNREGMHMRSGSGGKDRHHPAIPRLVEALEQRKLDRREFLRTATLLGMAAPVAYGIAGKVLGQPLISVARADTPKKGGILRVGMRVPALDNPATYSWIYDSNCGRQANEYLSRTQPDGVTVPFLLEKWEPSDDLKMWTLTLRKGIKWSNGEEMV